MPNSTLTITQKLDLFTALEVPYATQYNSLSSMGSLSMQTDVGQAGQDAAKTKILQYLESFGLTAPTGADAVEYAAIETELKSLLDSFHRVRLSVGSVEGGQVSDVGGVTYSHEAKREQIKVNIQTIVPFYRHHEILAKQAMEARGVTVPFIR
jgi:hypothetical protein